jgi:hypothetical protein
MFTRPFHHKGAMARRKKNGAEPWTEFTERTELKILILKIPLILSKPERVAEFLLSLSGFFRDIFPNYILEKKVHA